MINEIRHAANTDARLASLLEEAREHAQIYLLAKERQRGFEDMGNLVTLREEFRDIIEKVQRHCREKGFPCELGPDDPDAAARAFHLIRK